LKILSLAHKTNQRMPCLAKIHFGLGWSCKGLACFSLSQVKIKGCQLGLVGILAARGPLHPALAKQEETFNANRTDDAHFAQPGSSALFECSGSLKATETTDCPFPHCLCSQAVLHARLAQLDDWAAAKGREPREVLNTRTLSVKAGCLIQHD
jgi:hypothetical protein